MGYQIYQGNSKLESEAIRVLRSKGIFETIKSNVSVLLKNSSYNGIQIDSIQVVNNETRHRGKRVTINNGRNHSCTGLQFRSKCLQYVHI